MPIEKLNAKVVEVEPTGDVWDYEQEWEHELCDCCFNCGRCCFALFCCPCFACKTMQRSGECLCQPLVPFSLMGFRTKIRTAFRINGTMCKDFCVTSFCPVCALLQISMELDKLEMDQPDGKQKKKHKRNK